MDRFVRLLAATLATFVIVTGTAVAQAPGDNGQIDQYIESSPSAEGNEPTGGGGSQNGGGGGGGGGGGDSPVLTPEQSENLAGQGADGAGVANLTEATAPPGGSRDAGSGSGAGGDAGNSQGSSGGAGSNSDTGSSSGGLAGAFDAVAGSDDGLGIALPLILAAVAVAGIAIGWRRRADRAA